jgi:hypothetical protein
VERGIQRNGQIRAEDCPRVEDLQRDGDAHKPSEVVRMRGESR